MPFIARSRDCRRHSKFGASPSLRQSITVSGLTIAREERQANHNCDSQTLQVSIRVEYEPLWFVNSLRNCQLMGATRSSPPALPFRVRRPTRRELNSINIKLRMWRKAKRRPGANPTIQLPMWFFKKDSGKLRLAGVMSPRHGRAGPASYREEVTWHSITEEVFTHVSQRHFATPLNTVPTEATNGAGVKALVGFQDPKGKGRVAVVLSTDRSGRFLSFRRASASVESLLLFCAFFPQSPTNRCKPNVPRFVSV